MKVIKQKNVWIDLEVVTKLNNVDPDLSPNNHLRQFLGMPLKVSRGRKGTRPSYKKKRK